MKKDVNQSLFMISEEDQERILLSRVYGMANTATAAAASANTAESGVRKQQNGNERLPY